MRLFYRKPFVLCCVFLIIGSLIGYFAAFDMAKPAIFIFLLLGAVFGIIAILRRKRSYFFSFVLPMLFAVLGVLYFAHFSSKISYMTEKYATDEQHEIEITVLSRSFISNYLSIYDIRTSSIDGEKVNLKMRLEAPYFLELESGNMLKARTVLSDFGTVNGFDQKHYYNSKGFYFIAECEDREYEMLGNRKSLELNLMKISNSFASVFEKRLNEESAGLVNAVFLGDRGGLSDSAKRDFKRTGGYHLLALSGMHLSVLTAIVGSFMAMLGIKKNRRYIVLAVLILLYVSLTGFGLSMVRSAIMLLATYVAYFIRARKDMLTSLSFAAAAIIVCSPSAIGDIGFWMSVLATFGIIVALPLDTYIRFKLRRMRSKKLRKLTGYIISTLIISFSAILFTLPFSCFCFGAISLVGPAVTLILSNAVSLILVFAPMLLLLSWIPIISDLLCVLCEAVSHFILGVSEFFSKMENIYVSLDYDFVIYLVLLLFIVIGIMLIIYIKHKITIPIFVVAWLIVFSVFEYNALTDPSALTEYIRHGQNEYICISTAGENVLIDISDGSYNKLYLAGLEAVRKGYCEIDTLVLTHMHKKHVNSLKRLASCNIVRRVLLPTPLNDAEESTALAIEYEMELIGVRVSYYGNDESVELYGTFLSAEHGYIKRSTHPIIGLDFTGNLELSYIGSSYLEADSAFMRENIIVGTHGPICKKPFVIDASESKLVSIADEELFSYASIVGGEGARLIKNTQSLRLISE